MYSYATLSHIVDNDACLNFKIIFHIYCKNTDDSLFLCREASNRHNFACVTAIGKISGSRYGFRGRPIQRKHFWLQGTLPWQPNFGQIRPRNHKNSHNFSCMQHIHAHFGFEIEFVLSENSSVTLPNTRDKGTLPWQPIFGLKLL